MNDPFDLQRFVDAQRDHYEQALQELRAGRLADVIDEIVQLRADLREEHGWVMDVYALGAGPVD